MSRAFDRFCIETVLVYSLEMRFNVALLYFVVLFKPALAVRITNADFDGIQTGVPFTVTWADNDAPVSMLLRYGNSSNVNFLKIIKLWSTSESTWRVMGWR